MKNILIILLFLLFTSVEAQVITSEVIKNHNGGKAIPMIAKAGSCGSPDGSMNVTTVNPPNYAWLQTNGYCNPAAYGTNPTVCWTFVPTSSSVSINSGYSTTGCANVSHGPFTLYGPGCVVFGAGLNFTGLTPGLTYTWCMTSTAWGGGPGCIGFTDYCPYYFNNVVLPVSLLEFDGHNDNNVNILHWKTASEINNDYFTLSRSRGGKNWTVIATVPGSGNSTSEVSYEYIDDSYINGINYYRLSQTDFNGASDTFDIVSINTLVYKKEKPVHIYDLIGQEVPATYLGFRVLWYEDGRRIPIVGPLRD